MAEERKQKTLIITVFKDGPIEIRVPKIIINHHKLLWIVLMISLLLGGTNLPKVVQWVKVVLELLK
jgi:hypothetical protein